MERGYYTQIVGPARQGANSGPANSRKQYKTVYNRLVPWQYSPPLEGLVPKLNK